MSHLPNRAPPAPAVMPEGEEQAPPGTRTMSMIRWGLVALMAVAAAGTWIHHLATAGVEERSETQFVCPMHPHILTDHKGECPICGMDLVPVAPAATAAEEKPAGRYTCPMHPAFVTEDAGARCPECHMKLVPVPEAPPAAKVPGLATVDLSQERVQLMGMKTAVAAREALGARLRVVGFVAPSEAAMVSVTARFPGFVESLPVQTGQRVEKGQVVATIYSPDLLGAQQAFLNATRWTGQKPASVPGLSSEALERDARQRLEQVGIAQQDMDQILSTGQALRALTVRAPISGHVTRKAVLAGAQIQLGQELFQIADLSTVWVLADVPQDGVGRVKPGQRASFAVPSYPGESFAGRVQLVYPALNAGTRTLQARVELGNRGLRLRPGMYGDVSLDTGAAPVVTIPAEALVDTGEHRYVFVDRGGGRFEPRPVRPGASSGGRVAVLEGLAEGERVVTTANFLLDSESRLRAVLEGAPAAPPPAAARHEAHEAHEGHGEPAGPHDHGRP